MVQRFTVAAMLALACSMMLSPAYADDPAVFGGSARLEIGTNAKLDAYSTWFYDAAGLADYDTDDTGAVTIPPGGGSYNIGDLGSPIVSSIAVDETEDAAAHAWGKTQGGIYFNGWLEASVDVFHTYYVPDADFDTATRVEYSYANVNGQVVGEDLPAGFTIYSEAIWDTWASGDIRTAASVANEYSMPGWGNSNNRWAHPQYGSELLHVSGVPGSWELEVEGQNVTISQQDESHDFSVTKYPMDYTSPPYVPYGDGDACPAWAHVTLEFTNKETGVCATGTRSLGKVLIKPEP